MSELAREHRGEKNGLAESSEAMPVFITGMPRSGTTLVSMLLNGHTHIAISPETHYYRKYFRKGNRRRCLSSQSRFERHVQAFVYGPEVEAFNFTLEQRELLCRQIVAGGERSHRAVLEPVLRAYAEDHGKSIFGEKTPSNVFFIKEIIGCFVECKIIHVLRDPRDVALSLSNVTWHRGNLLQYATEWKQAVDVARAARELHPARVLFVRYEDLLDRTDESLNEVCMFLGVEFEQTMLSYYENAVPNFNIELEPWKAKTMLPIDKSNTLKWKLSLPEEKCAIIEGLLKSEFDELGYVRSVPHTSAKARLTYAYLYLENLILSGHYWVRAAWLRFTGSY